jgi:hypothetical protein
VSPGRDPARHDRQDRAAEHASIAPAADHDPAGSAASVRRSAELPIADPVSVKSQLPAGGPTGSPTVSACPWPGTLDRRRRRKPPLDVERVMNDSWRASGRLRQLGPAGSTTSTVR